MSASADSGPAGRDAAVVRDSGTADSRPDSDPAPHDADHFAGLSVEVGGAVCLSCWRTLEVTASKRFVAADDSKVEQFELSDSEYNAVLELAVAPDVDRVLSDPPDWDCPLLQDPEVHVRIRWTDGSSQEGRISDGCFGHCDQPDHPYMRIKRALFALKEKYVSCPPAEQRVPRYCAKSPETPPPPIWRMLCAVCLDDCGVPLPEGVPKHI